MNMACWWNKYIGRGNTPAAQNPERTDNPVAPPVAALRNPTRGTDNAIAAPRPFVSADCEPERYGAIYGELDTNGNGLISQEEFTMAIDRIGLQVTPEYVARVWHVYDADGNGELDREEFSRMMMVLAIYGELDTNGNGLISQEEVTMAIDRIGLQVTPEYIAGVWHVYDADGNGELDREEFSRMMMVLAMKDAKSDVTVAINQSEGYHSR
eukprot:COSAG02_NODE_1492_length_12334_cov_29.721945_5_plen_211_part_00